jgi:hypothetical protein
MTNANIQIVSDSVLDTTFAVSLNGERIGYIETCRKGFRADLYDAKLGIEFCEVFASLEEAKAAVLAALSTPVAQPEIAAEQVAVTEQPAPKFVVKNTAITFEKRPAGDTYVIRLNGECIGEIVKFLGQFVVEFDHYDRVECAQNTAKTINAAKQLVRDYATAMECIGAEIRKSHTKMEAAAHPAVAIAKAVGCEIVSLNTAYVEVKIQAITVNISYRPYGYFVSIYGGEYGFDLLEEKRITSNSELKSELLYLSVDAESEAEDIAAHYAAAAQADEAAAQDEAAVMAHYEENEAPTDSSQKDKAFAEMLEVLKDLRDGDYPLYGEAWAQIDRAIKAAEKAAPNIESEGFVVLIDGTALAPQTVAKLAHKEGYAHIADYIRHVAQNYPVGAAVSVPIGDENWLLFLAEKSQTAGLIQLEFTQSADCFIEHE